MRRETRFRLAALQDLVLDSIPFLFIFAGIVGLVRNDPFLVEGPPQRAGALRTHDSLT